MKTETRTRTASFTLDGTRYDFERVQWGGNIMHRQLDPTGGVTFEELNPSVVFNSFVAQRVASILMKAGG